MGYGDGLRQSEAKAGARGCPAPIAPEKSLEDMWQVLVGNPDPVSLNVISTLSSCLLIRIPVPYPLGGCIPQCIVQEVGDHALDLVDITRDDACFRLSGVKSRPLSSAKG